ncbi:inactive disease resistance protein RPS4-like, partial [Fagus crenata]
GLDYHFLRFSQIVIPGSEILEWFSHQSMGPEVNKKLHYSDFCNDVMGIAFCAVVCSDAGCTVFSSDAAHKYIQWNFIANGKEIHFEEAEVDISTVTSDHILLSYISTTDLGGKFSKSLVEYDANGFCQIGIRFETYCWDKGAPLRSSKGVKKCGVRLL